MHSFFSLLFTLLSKTYGKTPLTHFICDTYCIFHENNPEQLTASQVILEDKSILSVMAVFNRSDMAAHQTIWLSVTGWNGIIQNYGSIFHPQNQHCVAKTVKTTWQYITSLQHNC